MFLVYNAILRGFGFCGKVAPGVVFYSKEFVAQYESCKIQDRMEKAGHKFSSTIHTLVSAVKKLQTVSSGVQGTMLYRGLGGLDTQELVNSTGFTEKGFTS